MRTEAFYQAPKPKSPKAFHVSEDIKAEVWGEPEDFGHRAWFDRKFLVLDNGELAVSSDWNATTWTRELGLPLSCSPGVEEWKAA